jgi:hypothetical protein
MRLRYRLYLVVAASMLPVAAILLQDHADRVQAHSAAVFDATMREARSGASALTQVAVGMRHLLSTLSRAPVIQSGDARRCGDYLAAMRDEFPATVAIGAADLQGNMYCSSIPRPTPLNISRRAYFRNALASDGFVVGETLPGLRSGRPSISFGYPIRGAGRTQIGVMFVAMELRTLAEQLQLELDDPGATLLVADAQGRVLLDLPTTAREGETLSGPWGELLQPGTAVARQIDSSDGEKIVAAVPLHGDAQGLYVIAARDKEAAMRAIGSWRDGVLLGLAILWALLLTWLMTRVSIVAPGEVVL